MHLSTAGVTGQARGSIVAGMNLNAVIERDLATGLLVGSVPGIAGAHTQGETIEEVRTNLAEVIELLEANSMNPLHHEPQDHQSLLMHREAVRMLQSNPALESGT